MSVLRAAEQTDRRAVCSDFTNTAGGHALKLWQTIYQLFAGEQAENKQIQVETTRLDDHEQRIQRLEQFKMKIGDDVTKLETLVPQVIAQSQADMKAAGTAQMLADEAKAELAAAENPDTVHRLEVQIERADRVCRFTAGSGIHCHQ